MSHHSLDRCPGPTTSKKILVEADNFVINYRCDRILAKELVSFDVRRALFSCV